MPACIFQDNLIKSGARKGVAIAVVCYQLLFTDKIESWVLNDSLIGGFLSLLLEFMDVD